MKSVLKKKEKVSFLRNKCIVIGAGRLGSWIAISLQNEGRNVTVLDKDSESLTKLEDFQGFTSIGDATDLSFLESNDIEKADMVIITTEDDKTNLFLADVCLQIYDVPKIFVRLNDSNKMKLLEETRIKPICPFLLSVEKFYSMYNG